MTVRPSATWPLLIVLLIGLLATIFSLFRIQSHIEKIETPTQIGPIWFATGLHSDLLKFEREAAYLALGAGSADEMRKRFDILWSKVDVVTTGATFAMIEANVHDTEVLRELSQLMRQMDVDVATLTKDDHEAIIEIIDRFEPYEARVHALILDLLEERSRTENEWRNSLVRISSENQLLSGAGVGLLLVLCAYLVGSERRSRLALAEKSKLLALAERANEAKSNFLSVVNHELRTPLTSINGANRILLSLLDNHDDPRVTRLLKLALRNGKILLSLVEDILDIERAAAGRLKYDMELHSIADILSDSVDALQEFAASEGVSLSWEPPDDVMVCRMDARRIGQVVMNLLTNAIKFSHEGSTIRLDQRQVDGWIEVIVADRGAGIPSHALPFIFDAFYQVEVADIRNANGTGLGLNIVKSIVEAHEGEIAVESEMGRGTTFVVRLQAAPNSDSGNELAAA